MRKVADGSCSTHNPRVAGSIPARPTPVTRRDDRPIALAGSAVQVFSKFCAVDLVVALRRAPGMRERAPGVWELIVEGARDPITGAQAAREQDVSRHLRGGEERASRAARRGRARPALRHVGHGRPALRGVGGRARAQGPVPEPRSAATSGSTSATSVSRLRRSRSARSPPCC
jgi:hypothetical protein